MADDTTKKQSPDLSAVLGELLSNKELMQKIGEIANNSKVEESERAEAKPASSTNIDSLLSNPDIMAKLPDVINVIKPLMSGGSSENNKTASFDKRMGLLMAMKPYLSPKRCEAIDYIARMSKLSETVKGLKL